ncbi:acetyltransferase, gnat family [Fulvivirga imtechensis AK7]|uniref:Acetyltransferase, gnat family n=2 Tax=Fulvivirga TaxID=396811 RepID=L8JJ96_9BACT|nr:acetyltransferase, gnat family [Fulvivirga imtechensis AK7]
MIRPYTHHDKEAVIHLLQLNTPEYFHPSEEHDFIEYLDKFLEHYFVVEEKGQIVGCGGYNFAENNTIARIAWDMIHPAFQERGVGKKLTLYRIDAIKKSSAAQSIVVRTSQLAYPFYEKVGFELEKVAKDFWAEGFDLYQMKMSIK